MYVYVLQNAWLVFNLFFPFFFIFFFLLFSNYAFYFAFALCVGVCDVCVCVSGRLITMCIYVTVLFILNL